MPAHPVEQSPGRSWAEAAMRAGGQPDACAEAGADLERRYAEPHRRYHTGRHVAAVLRDCAWLASELQIRARGPLVLAACAHDVVYDARPGEDERASAEWAASSLSVAGADPATTAAVVELVLATATHEAPAEHLAVAVLLDADLAILASGPEVYSAYVTAVRAEYASVPDGEWRAGRSAVLRGFLDRPALFATAPGRARWEAPARANVAAELARLDAR